MEQMARIFTTNDITDPVKMRDILLSSCSSELYIGIAALYSYIQLAMQAVTSLFGLGTNSS